MEHLVRLVIASVPPLTLIARFSTLKLELSSSFGSRAGSSQLVNKNEQKIIDRFVRRMIKPSRATRESNYTEK
jgi:hypothetical protein